MTRFPYYRFGKNADTLANQNLSEYRRMGSYSQQHLQVFLLFLLIRRHRFMQVIHYFSEIAFRRVRRKLVFFWGKIKSAKEIKFALDVRCGCKV